MSVLLALALVVHGCIHVGYLCSRSWPFEASDSWLITGLGAGSATVNDIGAALVLVTVGTFTLAALTAVRLLPNVLWRPLIAVATVASAIVLVMFVTVWTLPFLAIDAVLLWATFIQGWEPRRRTGPQRPTLA